MTQVPRSQDPPSGALVHPPRSDHARWNWLLLLPIVLPLLTLIYNRETPRIAGFPFFFWFQLLFPLLAAAVTAVVFVRTRARNRT